MKAQHQAFLLEMIRHGDKIKAYQSAYPDATGESLRKGAERLLKDPEIALFYYETVSKIRERAFQEAEQERKHREKEKLVDIQLKREALARIITGKAKIRKHIRMGDRIETVEEEVKPRDIIRAIEVDSKLAADYYGEKPAEKDEDHTIHVYIGGEPFDNAPPKTEEEKQQSREIMHDMWLKGEDRREIKIPKPPIDPFSEILKGLVNWYPQPAGEEKNTENRNILEHFDDPGYNDAEDNPPLRA